jgi:hypothetical protein
MPQELNYFIRSGALAYRPNLSLEGELVPAVWGWDLCELEVQGGAALELGSHSYTPEYLQHVCYSLVYRLWSDYQASYNGWMTEDEIEVIAATDIDFGEEFELDIKVLEARYTELYNLYVAMGRELPTRLWEDSY